MSTTPKLRIEMLPVEALQEYEGNARQHGETDITAIKKSIEQFGFNDPIGIWGDNIIVEGHGRLMAAKELGRRCYMMELDPHYCDVIIARWEAFTGRKAERIA